MIDVIASKFQTGPLWVHLPAECGAWTGVYARLRNWAIDGAREHVFTALAAERCINCLGFGGRRLRDGAHRRGATSTSIDDAM